MSRVNRREFVGVAGIAAVAVSLPAQEKAAVVERHWVDPKLRALPNRPWRKIHLDFHNSHHVEKIGADFDADEFGDTLTAANVDAIVVFAKDMHGNFYYPSKYGPVHPGLDFDLLGAQVKACRERDIEVYAYYCTTWDNHLSREHPEWRRVLEDGKPDLGLRGDGSPGWTALCLSRTKFTDLVLAHTREFVGKYELDGPWFDMPWPKNGTCWCSECQRGMRDASLDPHNLEYNRRYQHDLYKGFLKNLRDTSLEARPGCQVDYNEQGGYRLAERVAYSDNMDIEALPTAQWGYFFFPTNTRYIRTHGITTYGMTGRFQTSWADFGGLKLPQQLDAELAGIVAQGARCDIGDQMPPNGRLDPAVYHVIGKSYGRIKKLEPYLDGAVPVTEAAFVTGGMPFDMPSTPANYGLVKLLNEARVQFDVVEPDQQWERYGLVVLPDDQPPDRALASRLNACVANGGAVVANNRSGLIAGTDESWLKPHGFTYRGPSQFKPAYMVPKANFTGDIPAYEYALYEGAARWSAKGDVDIIATLGEPAFQRTKDHYTSHRQTPFDHETDYVTLARKGRVGLAGFPLGLSYYNHGYWVYRRAFEHLLRKVYPTQLIESNAPLSAELSLTHQAASGQRKERYLVHIVNYSALRSSPQHPDFYEDPVALTDVRVRVNLPIGKASARAVVSGETLNLRAHSSGAVEFTVPRIPVNELVCIELG
jgi:putative glycosyl hydrolase-like family 6 (GHL6) protein/glycosyl hydrolase family 42 (putative beta-galactosidase)